MRFDVVNVIWFKAGIVQCFLQHGALRWAVRGGHGAGMTVMIDRSALNDSKDVVAVRSGVAEALERNHAAAFTLSEPIGPGIEGFAATVWREGIHLTNANEVFGGED